jgi:hypothetical protein
MTLKLYAIILNGLCLRLVGAVSIAASLVALLWLMSRSRGHW